ncbi:MAG: hypothetical protein U0Q15_04705 [Kineosporiaceae bacterium]
MSDAVLPAPAPSAPRGPGAREVVVRALALAALFAGGTAAASAATGPTSFAGIWVIAALVVVTGAWAFRDGRRGGDRALGAWIRCWLAVQALLAGALVVTLLASSGGLVAVPAAFVLASLGIAASLAPLAVGASTRGGHMGTA